MAAKQTSLNSKQLLFKELFVGTLIYAVVLGFFNDYTSIVYAKSFSTIFYAAIILEVLTYLSFMLKGSIIDWLNHREGAAYRALMFFCVWLVLFFSKFIFIWALDIVFSNNIDIHGFFGIFFIVLTVTLAHKFADKVFKGLGDAEV